MVIKFFLYLILNKIIEVAQNRRSIHEIFLDIAYKNLLPLIDLQSELQIKKFNFFSEKITDLRKNIMNEFSESNFLKNINLS